MATSELPSFPVSSFPTVAPCLHCKIQFLAGEPLAFKKGNDHALVPLHCILLRRRVLGERNPPFRQWGLGERLPEPLRVTARDWPFFLNGQCHLGPFQPCCRIPPRLPCRNLRSTKDTACAHPRCWHPCHVGHACPCVRSVSRWIVLLTREALMLDDEFEQFSPRSPCTGRASGL